jgi:hypothetical protein
MSTLAVVEAILREAAMPLSVREIVERAGETLPTKSKTPDTVVARDLSMDIKKKGEGSAFVRSSPGRYAMREQVAAQQSAAPAQSNAAPPTPGDGEHVPLAGQSLPHDRNGTRPAPAKPAPAKQNSEDTPLSA